jgi:hypothetical protein
VKAKGKAKSAKCTKAGKSKFFCRGCKSQVKAELYALTHRLCLKDKRALDNLRGFAARQGKKEWLLSVEQDEERLCKLLAVYHQRCPEKDAGGKRGKFIMAEYIEEYEASTEILKDDVGEMMEEEEFIEFCKTVKGGKLTFAQAQTKWCLLKDSKGDNYHDFGGKGGDIRFRVTVKDTVVFRNAFRHTKETQFKGKAVKNPDQNAMDQMRRDIALGHDGMEGDFHMQGMAKLMVGAGSSGSQDFRI